MLWALTGLAAAEIDHNRARINYMLNCQGCHLPDGSGVPGSVPTMKNFVGNFLHVPGGRRFLVQVPGSANAPVSDAELAELLNWILITMSPEELPEDYPPYTAEEVGAYRSTPLTDVDDLRPELVAGFEDQ
jgi:hypothetical protein